MTSIGSSAAIRLHHHCPHFFIHPEHSKLLDYQFVYDRPSLVQEISFGASLHHPQSARAFGHLQPEIVVKAENVCVSILFADCCFPRCHIRAEAQVDGAGMVDELYWT